MTSRFKVSESDIQHYVPPELKGHIVGMRDDAIRPQTVEEIEALQKQAYDEAVKAGHAEGLKQGLQEAAKLQNIFNFLQQPLNELDKQVEHQLTDLTMTLAKMLLQKESQLDAEHIQNLIHQSLDYLPVKSRDIQVRLNAADIDLLNQAEIDTAAQSWKCVEDNSITQGGCVIESSTSHIDSTVENRIQQLVDQLNLHQDVE
ncbi:MAG: FliH/SctL family protein [Gammaproteobacteria bacterium]|nr:FliH/SctL family protein [Gammaproteobacteria bacterium]